MGKIIVLDCVEKLGIGAERVLVAVAFARRDGQGQNVDFVKSETVH